MRQVAAEGGGGSHGRALTIPDNQLLQINDDRLEAMTTFREI